MMQIFPKLARAMALAMVILVAAPAAGLGQLLYSCAMTGEVGPRCCCMHEAKATALDGPVVATAPCCEIVRADPLVQPMRVEVVSPELETPDLIALPERPDDRRWAQASTGLVMPTGARTLPPHTGPPLFIRHCSILI